MTEQANVADTATNVNDEEVRIQLISAETGEPLREADGSLMFLDTETSRMLIQAAEEDNVSVEDKLAEVVRLGMNAETDE